MPVKISEALWLPVADGVKVTLTVQVPLGVIVAPVQVSALIAKSPTFVPPTMTDEKVRSAVSVLVTVSVWGVLAVPTFCGPNVRLSSEKLAKGPVPPVEIFATNASGPPWFVACNGLAVGKSVELLNPVT